MEHLLRCEGLEKKYGDRLVVDHLSFQVKKGEIYGLLGPNGAGKSTTISMICGLLQPDAGKIEVQGMDIRKHMKEVQRLLGVVPQDIALYLNLSARDNLLFWGRMYDLKGKDLEEKVSESLEIVGLSDRAKDLVGTFSGGMKRRVNIAASIIHNPKLLIMDEPTVGIDPQSRNHILETVKQLNKEGMSVIYTSHYMEEVEFLCDRIGIIDRGKMIAQGTLKEIIQLIDEKVRIAMAVTEAKRIFPEIKSILPEATLEEDKIIVYVEKPEKIISTLIQIVTKMNGAIKSIDMMEPNLESCFLHLTGRSLRDG
jgi:ABC-2 type transport system ATP-binding protein